MIGKFPSVVRLQDRWCYNKDSTMYGKDRHSYHSDGRWGSVPAHKLVEVKHTMYHPLLPSLHRTENVGHKSRNKNLRSTPACPSEYHSPLISTSNGHSDRQIPTHEITMTGEQMTSQYSIGTMAPLALGIKHDKRPSFTHAADDWSKFISSSGELQLQDSKKFNLGYSLYAVRFLSPDITRSWRYSLQQNPSLDQYGQKPLPVETINTFRSFGSKYSPTTYLRPWH
ncbi:testis, prostate and placenta-expressed protein [Bombina bombina]|uniref:testis, prostate and placenta-expressed protein n=1 Tax=Bombina bombina TaxID=8345 RepID=UPI00235AB453|nr:testis, prostate and placenta-expressed protein [Bombina bombina]